MRGWLLPYQVRPTVGRENACCATCRACAKLNPALLTLALAAARRSSWEARVGSEVP